MTDKKNAAGKILHGLASHPLYNRWCQMHNRCSNVNRKDYKHYGGRGITVCERWATGETADGLRAFIEDMGPTFEPGLELDRINVNGQYEPSNCRWATRRIQVINRRSFGKSNDTHLIEFNGKTQCISMWAEELGIGYSTLRGRLNRDGMSVEDALMLPRRVGAIKVKIGELTLAANKVFKSTRELKKLRAILGATTEQVLADIFHGIGAVVIKRGSSWIDVRSIVNRTNLLQTNKLTDECKQAFLNSYGVTDE